MNVTVDISREIAEYRDCGKWLLRKWNTFFQFSNKTHVVNNISVKCPYVLSVRPYVRPSTKIFSDFNEIWYVDRGRWVMHEGMAYDPIRGHGQGHESFRVQISSIFNICLLRHLQWELTNNHWLLNYSTISKFDRAWFLIFGRVFVSREFELGRNDICDCPNFFSSDLNEIWCVDRGQWVMHDGMPYDPIWGQGQGHESDKFRISSIFNICLLRHLQWELVNDHWFLN